MITKTKTLWTILVLVFLVALVHPAAGYIVPSTVLYIPGNATVPGDISPQQQTVVIGGLTGDCTVSSTCSPKWGTGAIYFNGTTDYLNTTVKSMNLANNSWYMGLWVNDTATAVTGNVTYLSVNTNVTGTGNYAAFAIQRRGNLTQYSMSYNGTGWDTIATGSSGLATSKWNYIACNHTPTLGVACYVNGSADATIAVTPNLYYNGSTGRTYIGAKPLGGVMSNFTTATMDDVVIINGQAYNPAVVAPWEYTHSMVPAFALNHTFISDYALDTKNLINVTSNVYDITTTNWAWSFGDPLQPALTSSLALPIPGVQYWHQGIFTITETVNNSYTSATNSTWVLAVN